MTDTYRKALGQARKELADAMRQQGALELRIIDLRQTVATLSRLCGEDAGIEEQVGITDAVRMALKAASRRLTLTEVKEAVEELGFPLWKQAAPLASVATILSRLQKSGEAQRMDKANEKPTWAWQGIRMPKAPPRILG